MSCSPTAESIAAVRITLNDRSSVYIALSLGAPTRCYLFTVSNSGLLSMQRPRPANHVHLTPQRVDHAQPAADKVPTAVVTDNLVKLIVV